MSKNLLTIERVKKPNTFGYFRVSAVRKILLPQGMGVHLSGLCFADVVPQNTAKNHRFSLDESRFTSASSSIFDQEFKEARADYKFGNALVVSSYFAKFWSGARFSDIL